MKIKQKSEFRKLLEASLKGVLYGIIASPFIAIGIFAVERLFKLI